MIGSCPCSYGALAQEFGFADKYLCSFSDDIRWRRGNWFPHDFVRTSAMKCTSNRALAMIWLALLYILKSSWTCEKTKVRLRSFVLAVLWTGTKLRFGACLFSAPSKFTFMQVVRTLQLKDEHWTARLQNTTPPCLEKRNFLPCLLYSRLYCFALPMKQGSCWWKLHFVTTWINGYDSMRNLKEFSVAIK